MANNIGWGQGTNNNNIGWGQGASNNDIGWGSIYALSPSGETDIIGGDERFIISVKTDNAGTSTSTQFTLPWTGTYDVDWGDGTVEEGVVNSQTHTYASAGTYDIAITAATGQIRFNNGGDKAKLVDIKNWGDVAWTNMNSAFWGCTSLTAVSAEDALVLPADSAAIFRACSSLITLDVSSWDTSNVSTMLFMFFSCSSLTALDVSEWDTSNVSNMFYLFGECSSLNNLDVSSWDTSSVTTMQYMFFYCSSLTALDVSNWDTSGVARMDAMFYLCGSLKADLSGLDIASVTNLGTFAQNTQINELDGLGNQITTNYDNTLIAWEAELQTAYPDGVGYTPSITTNFGTAKYSWRAIEARNSLVNTFGWSITDGGLLEEPEFVITVETTTASESFTIPTTGTGYSYNVDWGDGSTSTSQTGNATHTYASAGQYDIQITGTFPRIYFNNTGDRLKLIDIKNWGDGTWTSMADAFYGCSSLTAVSAEDALILPANSSSMFRSCSSLITLNTSNWDTSNVSSSVFAMFAGCSSLTTLDVSSWDTSSVTNMNYIFSTCSSLTTLDVSSWDTSSVTNMGEMFQNCSNLKADLSGLDIASVTNFSSFAQNTQINELDGLGNQITTNYDNTLISFAAQTPVSGRNVHFGTAQYSLGGAAEAARTTLVTTYGWTITDGGGVGVNGLLDIYTGATAAYSLRNLSASTTNVVRVRADQGVGVQPEQDFTYLDLYDGTLETFVGAGNDGFVVTWYDQAGSNDATQNTAASQPKIVSSGSLILVNGMASLLSDGVDDYLSAAYSASNPTTQFIVYDKVGSSGTLVGLFSGASYAPGLALNANGVYAYQNGPSFGPTYVNNNQSVVSLKSSTIGTDWAMWGNGSSVTNSGENIGTASPTSLYLMSRGGGTTLFGNTYLQEYIVYPSDQTSNQANIEDNINTYYSIY
jgi:surface protein